MNPSFSNAPISNLLEATRSTELRLARNHSVFCFRVGAPPMAALKTLSVIRHRHLCPCLSTMPKPIPSNSISNPSFKRDKGISCSPARAVTIAESSLSDIENHNADRRERKENNRNRRRAFSLITGCSRLGFMPWQKLASPVPAEVRAQLQRKMRMLVDESLGRRSAKVRGL
jgi:hypothetical protein